MAVLLLKTLVIAAVLGSPSLSHAADRSTCKEPIEFKSDGSSEFDFGTDSSAKTTLRNVSISQCDVSIRADLAEATNLDSNDSHWVFTRNVRVVAEQRGSMESDRAEVELRGNRIARATIYGNPAQFEQKPTASSLGARGHAKEIVYDVNAGTVRFTQDVRLTYGEREVNAELCTYNIRQANVHCERVRGTILPKEAESEHPLPNPTPLAGEGKGGGEIP